MEPVKSRRETMGGRLAQRADERASFLHGMRRNILAIAVVIAVGQVALTALWLGLAFAGFEAASRGWAIMSIFLNLAVTFVVVFLTWMVLEALGRIDREADRIQQFMDNVYRRV